MKSVKVTVACKAIVTFFAQILYMGHCPFAENKMTFFNFPPVEYKRQRINQATPECVFVKLSVA